jgi:TnsA endonuclease-like protein
MPKPRTAKKGRGSGRGQQYDPYLHIQNVPSTGRVSRVKGYKANRLHHCLSKLEWMFFWILEWSPIVVDIREQYPLDVGETLAIASQLDIRHPINRKTSKPEPLTTDFLVTVMTTDGPVEQARTIKPMNKLSSSRVMEKFEIERIYWERRNIDWGIVTEKDIDSTLAVNVEMAFFYRDLAKLYPLDDTMLSRIESELTVKVIRDDLPLKYITRDTDNLLNLPLGTSSKVVLHLLANRRWLVNMHQPIRLTRRMVFTSTPALLLT